MVHLHGSGAPHTLAPAPAVGFAFPDFASKTSLISSSEAWGLGRENNVGLVDLVDALAFTNRIQQRPPVEQVLRLGRSFDSRWLLLFRHGQNGQKPDWREYVTYMTIKSRSQVNGTKNFKWLDFDYLD